MFFCEQTLGTIMTKFPYRTTKAFAARISAGKADDPLLLQILPTKKEKKKVQGFKPDPLLEKKFAPIPGLLHKYFGRVLLLVTDKCPINCRYCFRRYMQNKITDWKSVFNYIANDSTIAEVILSGGEPLMLSDSKLANIIEHLAKIPQVQRVRIHTRIPIVLPKRITTKLTRILTASRLQVIIVVHCNHPQEIDNSVQRCFLRLRKANISLLNQSVLLKGVNNSSAILAALSEKLFASGVLPYYLHLLDKVEGAAHFLVKTKDAIKIHHELQKRLPGYLVPKLVCEKPGAKAKLFVVNHVPDAKM